ncbi:hypothetical protein G3I59_27790 [Amycolatopsis rubida]|uniref:Uncharacterized protein n=1 Tax=Amycolatopsis rubida TaxID=112413 RepID=A0ABX0BUI3_9PSEU|nr:MULTISPECIES: hypothetical protein [Amycolatopsis]MYW94298.1 hypothetical protein [Amycolatopsis rubida]NEC59287.1 hypothetical protein [Amycolatopsis rubida]OAP23164.1 hypothetical protein A4R44_05810 [Amycolatopsis sp. M39]
MSKDGLPASSIIILSAGAADFMAQASNSAPIAGALGAAAAAVGVAAEGVRRRQQEQAANSLAFASSLSGLEEEEVVSRLLGTPGGTELLSICLNGAARSVDRRKLRVLGASLAAGSIQSDDALLDEDLYLSQVVADLEAPHLALLDLLNEPHPELAGTKNMQAAGRLRSRVNPPVLARQLIATLERHGLIYGWSRESYSMLHKSTRAVIGVNLEKDPVMWSITEFGEFVLARFLEVDPELS